MDLIDEPLPTMMIMLPGVVAFVVAWWLTDRLCSSRSSVSILAHPNERTLHSKPTPQTGGVAIIAGVVIGLLVAASVLAILHPEKAILPKGVASGSVWIIVSMLLIFVVSFIDDYIGVHAGLRFAVQAGSAVIIVSGVGLTLSSIPIPGGPTIHLGLAAIPVSVLLLMWMANLYNFMDGMDGFAGGMTCWGFGFLAYCGWQTHFPVLLIIASLVALSALGFLLHNFPPARIFMGDAGSITLGFLGGTLLLLGVRDHAFDVWVPVMIFSPFIVDATVTLVRRALRFEKIWMAHRQHYYQRLVLNGWSHRRTVLVEYGLMLICGGMAVMYHHSSDQGRLVILASWASIFVVLALLVHRMGGRQTIPRPAQDDQVPIRMKQTQTLTEQDTSKVTVEV